MRARRFLRLAVAPAPGATHLSDAWRRERTLCGKGVLVRDGWKLAQLGAAPVVTCRVCSAAGARRYGL